MIDLSLIKVIPAEESHREFYYIVKKEAYGGYITRVWGWDEQKERDFQAKDWQEKRPAIITYNNQPIGTIYVKKDENYIEIGQFYILPEYHNQGIGSHLLKDILDSADKTGLIVKLAVLKINPAMSLYRRHGLEVVREEEVFYFMERKPKETAKNGRKYQAVIFDLFGTLVDNFTLTEYEGILKEMALILNTPEDEFRRLWSASFNDRVTGVHGDQRDSIVYICSSLGITVSTTQVDKAFGIRLDYSARFLMKPTSGAIETLTKLRNDGYKTGLISDCTGEVPLLWQETPFRLLFDATIFSCKARIKKPNPRIYHLATEKLEVKPQDCLYIGDGSSKELTGASGVGMHPVLIRDPRESVDAHYIDREDDWSGTRISALQEVLNLLD